MHYDSKTDWMATAERLLQLTFPPSHDQGEFMDPKTDVSDKKLPMPSRLGIILFGAFASWAVLVAIGWALVTVIRAFLGH